MCWRGRMAEELEAKHLKKITKTRPHISLFSHQRRIATGRLGPWNIHAALFISGELLSWGDATITVHLICLTKAFCTNPLVVSNIKRNKRSMYITMGNVNVYHWWMCSEGNTFPLRGNEENRLIHWVSAQRQFPFRKYGAIYHKQVIWLMHHLLPNSNLQQGEGGGRG